MKIRTHTHRRLVNGIVLALAAGALAAPAAQAGDPAPPDAVDRYVRNHVDATAGGLGPVPDAVYRYIRNNPTGDAPFRSITTPTQTGIDDWFRDGRVEAKAYPEIEEGSLPQVDDYFR